MRDDLIKRLGRVDLNLLPVLLVLIETQSTQATADRIGRTQSAVSHALNRLRVMLNDQLFVRHGPRLVPTPLVHDLKEPLGRLLHDSVALIDRGAVFDPTTAERQIVIGCFDLALPLADHIVRQLGQDAPNLRFRITGPRNSNSALRNGEVDLLLSMYRNKADRGQTMTRVGQLDWGFFAAPRHGLPEHPTARDWAAAPHVQVHTGPGGRTPVDDAAGLAGVQRHVSLQVGSFMEALYVVSQGDCFFTTFRKLAGPLARQLGLSGYPMPFDLPPAPLSVVTRQVRFDPLAAWLHDRAVAASQAFLQDG